MIYFIKDAVTLAVKVGYSKKPKKRLATLQTTAQNELVLLGSVHGGLDHEGAFQQKFAQHRLRGEWSSIAILSAVLRFLPKKPSIRSSRR